MAAYQEALQELHRAPVNGFLAERKRLAAELRAGGDKEGAARLELQRKPTASVWAVNQLYWHARDAFDQVLAAAERLRQGDLGASRAYHDGLGKLRQRAAGLLQAAGLGASDATLRRVGTTLAAIAAGGGFDPDPPGALTSDRDPPGFEAFGLGSDAGTSSDGGGDAAERAASAAPRRLHVAPDAKAEREAAARRAEREQARRDEADERAARAAERERDEAERRRADAAERKREEVARRREHAERARRRATQQRLESALRDANAQLRSRERTVAAREKELRAAEKALGEAREQVADLERRIGELDAAE